jgi:hypothetical protein
VVERVRREEEKAKRTIVLSIRGNRINPKPPVALREAVWVRNLGILPLEEGRSKWRGMTREVVDETDTVGMYVGG